jgi:hypothetical protein
MHTIEPRRRGEGEAGDSLLRALPAASSWRAVSSQLRQRDGVL